jgi:hypothetical protein
MVRLTAIFATGVLALAVTAADPPVKDKDGWKLLFDGKSLDGWKAADYTEAGKVHVKDAAIVLDRGVPMTGVAYRKGDFPKLDYEVNLEAKRVEGSDFFCTTTFPVGDSFCSLVVGGWGGMVVGLSSVNHEDASENETTGSKEFAQNKWYKVRIRVTKDRISAWIDDEQVVNLDSSEKKLTIRRECEPCKPFGFATWKTTGAVRAVRVRPLTEAEKKAAVNPR